MSETTAAAESIERPREIRYKQAALLLEKWLADESEYDADTWKRLQPELRDATTRCEDTDENPA